MNFTEFMFCRSRHVLIAKWIAGFLILSPVFWDGTLTGYLCFPDDCSFYLNQAAKEAYYLLAIVVYFIIPSVLMPYLYTHILYVVCGSYKKIKKHLDSNSKNINLWHQIKLSIMLMCVYLSFLLAFLPYFALFITELSTEPMNPFAYQLSSYLMNVQSMANFIIYGTVNLEFRNAYKRLLSCKLDCICRKRRSSLVAPLANT